MALQDVLASIPGRGAFLAQQQFEGQQQAQGLGQVLGVLGALQRDQEMKRQAQLQPLQERLMRAQAGAAEGLEQNRAMDSQFQQKMPELVKQATNEDGSIDYRKLADLAQATPGGTKFAMDTRKHDEDRAVRVQQGQALIAQREAQANQYHEARMAAAQTQTDKAAEIARHNRTLEAIAQMRSDSAAQTRAAGGKPPAGYRWKPDGGLEPIPGGPADEKASLAGKRQAAREDMVKSRADLVIGKVDEALDKVGTLSTGFVGQQLGKIAGTKAYNLDRAVDTIKANIGFQELQAMREASPTGGALGQVAVQELNMLQAVLSSLDIGQDKDVLRANLEKVKEHYTNWKKTVSGESGATGGWSIKKKGE